MHQRNTTFQLCPRCLHRARLNYTDRYFLLFPSSYPLWLIFFFPMFSYDFWFGARKKYRNNNRATPTPEIYICMSDDGWRPFILYPIEKIFFLFLRPLFVCCLFWFRCRSESKLRTRFVIGVGCCVRFLFFVVVLLLEESRNNWQHFSRSLIIMFSTKIYLSFGLFWFSAATDGQALPPDVATDQSF